MRRTSRLLLVSGVLALIAPSAWAQETRVLIVVGLGGDPEYRETFHGWASALRSVAVERFGVGEEGIVYLGERPEEAPELIQDRSTRENIASALAAMAEESGAQDRVLVVLIGHGSGQGESARFNLPGPDLSPGDLDVMLNDFPTQVVAVVNTSPSSGPFVGGLAGENRIVVTATKTIQERNETQFGGFFVEALESEGSDLDKDGRVSLLEAFQYASREVDRYYQERNLLATEHAQLEDDGDGIGSTEVGEDATDGWLARGFWLGSTPGHAGASAAVPDSVTDPVLLRLYEERTALERRISELRALRGQMEESRYEQELEELLVAMALKNREIREREGGG
ncbi:MAG: hypothetical protein ACWGSQ_01405 [Longimicrobiales bacterium]